MSTCPARSLPAEVPAIDSELALGTWLIDDTITSLVLLLPVVAASALGSWRTGLVVALVDGFAYALTFLTPIGSVRIGLTRDVLVIATFVVVAVVVGIVTRRSPRAPGRGGDDQLVLRAVSHDLRNPLSTIRAASSDRLSGGGDDEDYRAELLSLVASESERSDRIVGNLLSVDRVRSGALTPHLEPESIADLLGRSATLRRVLRPGRFTSRSRTVCPTSWSMLCSSTRTSPTSSRTPPAPRTSRSGSRCAPAATVTGLRSPCSTPAGLPGGAAVRAVHRVPLAQRVVGPRAVGLQVDRGGPRGDDQHRRLGRRWSRPFTVPFT